MQATPYSYVKPECAKAVSRWLLLCVLLICIMVAVGGYTRLSGSGLSITEWKPIHGTVPPLSTQEWNEEFDKYRAIPQYQQLNKGMSLDEFKGIYWPEYWHRNLGRLIGMIYALPMFFFLFKGAFARGFAGRMLVILGLGGLQGLIGWIMVASGLQDRLYVSHIKLALHFGTAMLLLMAVFWTWLDVSIVSPPRSSADSHMRQRSARSWLGSPTGSLYMPSFTLITLLIFAQLIMGALVAGLHAGLIYNSFPLMNGDLIAPDVFTYVGSWFDHIPMVQFVHRWGAKFIVLAVIVWWWVYRKPLAEMKATGALVWLAALLFAQFVLGILTLINAVPLWYALMHQLGGVFLLLAALNMLHRLKP